MVGDLRLSLVLLRVAAVAAAYSCDTSSAFRADVTAAAASLLTSQGYHVSSSTWRWNGNVGNPDGSYAAPGFKGISEVIPPSMCPSYGTSQWLNPVQALNPFAPNSIISYTNYEFCNGSYPVAQADAIVSLFCTPPPMKYFSVGVYAGLVFADHIYPAWAELAAPINLLKINTTNSTSGGGPFGKTALVISTASRQTWEDIVAAFTSAGVPWAAVNTLPIPVNTPYIFYNRSKPWSSGTQMSMMHTLRTAYAFNVTEIEEYYAFPQEVLYVQAPTSVTEQLVESKGPYLYNDYSSIDRSIPKPEGPPLQSAFNQLVSSTIDLLTSAHQLQLTYQVELTPVLPNSTQSMTDPTYFPVIFNIDVPAWYNYFQYLLSLPLPPAQLALLKDVEALSFTHQKIYRGAPTADFFTIDALYQSINASAAFTSMTWQNNRTFVIVGVNHVTLNEVLYNEVVVSATSPFTGYEQPQTTTTYDGAQLEGTALPYGPSLPYIENMFVFGLSPYCNGIPSCRQLTPSQAPTNISLMLPYVRNYVNPNTTFGPAPGDLVNPILMVFEPSPSTTPPPTSAPSAGPTRSPTTVSSAGLSGGQGQGGQGAVLGRGEVIGIVVGTALGLGLVVAGGMFGYRRWRAGPRRYLEVSDDAVDAPYVAMGRPSRV